MSRVLHVALSPREAEVVLGWFAVVANEGMATAEDEQVSDDLARFVELSEQAPA